MTKKSDAPAIRFKGFSDAWEQRKVSDLAEKTYGGGTPTTSNEDVYKRQVRRRRSLFRSQLCSLLSHGIASDP